MYWILDDKGTKIGVPIKASALVSRPTMKNLQSKFQANEQFRPLYKERLTKVIDSFFQPTHRHTRVNFCEYLNSYGINPAFSENKDGTVFGITFIENTKGAVINRSDLGKKYSGQALAKWLNNRATGEGERQKRVTQGLAWPQLERYDHSQPDWRQGTAKPFLILMKAEKCSPEQGNPYLKRKKKKKRGKSL